MLRSLIKKLTNESLEAFAARSGVALSAGLSYQIEQPKNPDHGDFSVDVAFLLSKQLKRAPFMIADELAKIMKERIVAQAGYNALGSVTVYKPGFINFTVCPAAWCDVIRHVLTNGETYGASREFAGQRVLLEYVSANPTGPLTIAHGRQACLGDTLANVMKLAGYDVAREYYLNDGGRQIRLLGTSVWVRYCACCGVDEPFPEEGYQGEYIRDIAAMVFEKEGGRLMTLERDEAIKVCSTFAVAFLMGTIKQDLQTIQVSFDSYFSEQTLYRGSVDEVLAELNAKQLLFEEEGALWFRSTQFGDDKDRVLRKSSGEYTYLVPDIAYHREKFRRGFTRVIDFLGPDHHGYILRLKAAVKAMGYNPDALEVLIVQLTTLYKNGEPLRMSTRAGNFISLRELIDEVGADATRFFFLMRKVDSHLDFDLTLAKERSQDNPVFYLQYAHARIASIFRSAEKKVTADCDLSLLAEADELALIKLLHEYPYQIIQTARTVEPYRIGEYLKEVAAAFHRFYSHHRVVTENEPLTAARLALCECVRIVLRNGLRVLGVSQPEQM